MYCSLPLRQSLVLSQQHSNMKRRWQCNLANLCSMCTSLIFCGSLELSVSCQQTDLILAIASQSTLCILGLTETWIRSEDSATPSVLSNNSPFSIYHLLGQLGTFIEELDELLSSFSGDGSPLVVFGDFSIHLEKPYTADFQSLTHIVVSQTAFWENL